MHVYKVFLYIFSISYFAQIQQVFTIASNTPDFPLPERFKREESVFEHIYTLLNKHSPLNLGGSAPDYPPFEEMQHALANAATSKDYSLSQYSLDHGHPRLLKIISKFYSKLLNRTPDPDKNVIVTSEATEASFVTFLTHTFPGDEWIIFEPFYEYYVPMIRAANGIPRFIKLEPPAELITITSADWAFDIKKNYQDFLTKKQKGILINAPHNPSATLPGMFERTIMIGSAGKMFGVSGYRIGWTYGDAKLLNNLKAAHNLVVMSAPTPIQDAVAVVMEQEVKNWGTSNSFLERWRKQTESKKDYLYRILLDFGMKPVLPDGGYFISR